ncbi:MAG: hypothetical protein ACJAYC_000233 [Halieaceae bacterium]|jgi:hypothetical protein
MAGNSTGLSGHRRFAATVQGIEDSRRSRDYAASSKRKIPYIQLVANRRVLHLLHGFVGAFQA